jgi:glycosyltransferase 2 family protein
MKPSAGDDTTPGLDPWWKRRRPFIGLVVSAVSLGAVVWWASRQEAPTFPTSASGLGLLGAAVGLYGVATLLRGWRWHAILRRSEIGHGATDAYALTAVGYMGNTVLPARGGELLRVGLLAPRSTGGHGQIAGSIVAERMVDAVALAALFGVMTWIGVGGTPVGRAPGTLGVIAVLLALAGAFGYLRLRRQGRMERLAVRMRPLTRATRLLLGLSGVALLALTVVVWMLEGVILFLVGQSLGVGISVPEAAFLIVLASFFALIPAAPGYVGTFDAAILFGLAALDVKGGSAVAFALLVRFVLFVPITGVGLILLLARYGGLPGRRGREPLEYRAAKLEADTAAASAAEGPAGPSSSGASVSGRAGLAVRPRGPRVRSEDGQHPHASGG